MSVRTFDRGKKYRVKADHPFHPNRIGIFEFLGGVAEKVVVMSDPNSTRFCKNMFAVGLDDIDCEIKNCTNERAN
jgi:hypothetical protein